MIPLGDIASVMHLLITCNPEIDFVYIRTKNVRRTAPSGIPPSTRGSFGSSSGRSPFSEPEVSAWIGIIF